MDTKGTGFASFSETVVFGLASVHGVKVDLLSVVCGRWRKRLWKIPRSSTGYNDVRHGLPAAQYTKATTCTQRMKNGIVSHSASLPHNVFLYFLRFLLLWPGSCIIISFLVVGSRKGV
ncbi:hypothetical protein K402DRAFT_25690 [Aulographum hederae CBS 113979]|uniref:Uncharacterized protein n=1 Tax=Aulographum hederae CBS 113979 TaxID=1176131 RepID=A0A6G1H5V1_9PEZI|nr:hypothetical protein K402DRAFT_25690 [Aulographum hederae CBS 113979]